jgi:hypothetical protein
MTEQVHSQEVHRPKRAFAPVGSSLLQRRCACGGGTTGLTGECAECRRKRLLGARQSTPIVQDAQHSSDNTTPQSSRLGPEAYEMRHGHRFADISVFPAPSVARTPAPVKQEIPLRSPAVAQDGQVTTELRQVISALGPGHPLSASQRHVMQSLSEVPLDGVRVHDSRESHVTASALGSEAFAVGNNVVLGDPRISEKPRNWLLAHEVAHTIQQNTRTPRVGYSDSEKEADQFANQVTAPQPLNRSEPSPSFTAAPIGLANRVIARMTRDVPPNFLLVIDVDDGDFVGGCVRQYVPHVGAKLIMKGVPRTRGNQIFNLHVGVMTNAKGQYCVFFYESVSGMCDTLCFPTKEELKRAWERIKAWLQNLVETVILVLAIAALAVIVVILAAEIAILIAEALLVLIGLILAGAVLVPVVAPSTGPRRSGADIGPLA